jgi:hypothetical protein
VFKNLCAATDTTTITYCQPYYSTAIAAVIIIQLNSLMIIIVAAADILTELIRSIDVTAENIIFTFDSQCVTM